MGIIILRTGNVDAFKTSSGIETMLAGASAGGTSGRFAFVDVLTGSLVARESVSWEYKDYLERML